MTQETETACVVHLGQRPVGTGHPCYVIAEIGINHNADLSLARQQVAAAVESGADAVKFQTFRAEEFVADRELVYAYRSHDGREVQETQFEMFKRLELPAEWHRLLAAEAGRLGVDFLSSSADANAVDLLDSLGVPAFKLASEDLINLDLVAEVAARQRPAILSTGMATEQEISQALQLFGEGARGRVVLLHCVSCYPTPPHACNLRRIPALRSRFGRPVGFSDHTQGTQAATAAVALGACVVEKHFTCDRSLPGPDHAMSADPAEFREMVQRIRTTEQMLGTGTLGYQAAEQQGRAQFRRSVVAKRTIEAGEIIREDMLCCKRPGTGLKPCDRGLLLGRRTRRTIRPDEQITVGDIVETGA